MIEHKWCEPQTYYQKREMFSLKTKMDHVESYLERCVCVCVVKRWVGYIKISVTKRVQLDSITAHRWSIDHLVAAAVAENDQGETKLKGYYYSSEGRIDIGI